MYDIHAVNIKKFSKESPENLADVILMVVLSIQQDWKSVGKQIQDVKEHGAESRFLWGNKAKTYKYLAARKNFLFSQFLAVINSNKTDGDKALSLMKIFLQVPGLGLVKAGFCCQLTAGLVGCIDLHNIRLYGISENHLKISMKVKNKELIRQKINNYVSICHNIGTEKLWNNWCEHLSTKNSFWRDGFHVSEVHQQYLNLGEVA
jgi:hypothetical protein